MIVKKRKKKGNKKSKGLKKPHGPNLTSLKSLQLNYKLNKEEGENVQLITIKKEDKSKKFLNLVVYINEFDRIDEEGKQKCRNNDCENLICKPFRRYCSRKCSKEFT